MGERRAPAVQYAGHAYTDTEVAWIGRNGGERFGRRPEQQPIEHLLVPIGNLRDLCWHSEDDMEIFHGQQIFDPRCHPVARCGSLTLWAMPVLAGIVRDVAVPTFGTGGHVPAQRLRPAGLEHRHDLELAQTDMPRIGLPPRGPMGTEDISDLQLRPGHLRRSVTPADA